MYDGRHKPIKDIAVGDEIYGVNEERSGKALYYTRAVVLAKWSVEKPSYKITLEDGRELICSADHRWLSNRGWKYTIGELTINDTLRGFVDYGSGDYPVGDDFLYFDGYLKIASIEPYKDSQELIDITTTTSNFIADGVVSHNCYARSLLEFRGLWRPYDPSIADIEKIKRKLKKIEPGTILRLGGMTDCFQPIEKEHGVTYETIKEMNRLGIGQLIVTKSALVADDKYIGIYDQKLTHIQVSITTTSDEIAAGYDNASPISERIAAIEKLAALGFDVCVRLSPFIPEQVDFDVLSNIKCNKILVEFLRVNSAIRKIFDLDYSEYTLRQGNYWHLPLDKTRLVFARMRTEPMSIGRKM